MEPKFYQTRYEVTFELIETMSLDYAIKKVLHQAINDFPIKYLQKGLYVWVLDPRKYLEQPEDPRLFYQYEETQKHLDRLGYKQVVEIIAATPHDSLFNPIKDRLIYDATLDRS